MSKNIKQNQNQVTNNQEATGLPLKVESNENSKLESFDRFLSLKEVRILVPYSKVHINRLTKSGFFPSPYQLSERRIGWKKSDIETWLSSRKLVKYAPKAKVQS